MNLTLLTSDDRTELAVLYIAHLGDTDYCTDDIEFSPTRAFIAYAQGPYDPGCRFLSDEELLGSLQVTLHREWGPVQELVTMSRELLRTSLSIADIDETDARWGAFGRARDQLIATIATIEKPDTPTRVGEPYYTADPAFIAWLEDEKRGWPVLVRFLKYFEPRWYLDYLKELAAAEEDTERMHRADAHASMQGAAGAYGERRAG